MPFYDEDGREIHPDLVPVPDLCRICRKNAILDQYIFCSMRRIQRRNEHVFICFDLEPVSPDINRDELFKQFNEIIALKQGKGREE